MCGKINDPINSIKEKKELRSFDKYVFDVTFSV